MPVRHITTCVWIFHTNLVIFDMWGVVKNNNKNVIFNILYILQWSWLVITFYLNEILFSQLFFLRRMRDANMSCLHRSVLRTSHMLHARTSCTISWKYLHRQIGLHRWIISALLYWTYILLQSHSYIYTLTQTCMHNQP